MKNSLLDTLKSLPSSAGVYQYFNSEDKLLYVGKAKNLKNRVKSYFNFTPSLSPSSNLSIRISKMIDETYSMSYIEVNSEHDALILENSLIKQLKPKYNILLRDDKTYPYIYIDNNLDFPRFEITRKVIKKSNVKYFGPFSFGVKHISEALYDNFKLIQSKSCLRAKKSCLYYQINKCLAPCEGKISTIEYKKITKEASLFLTNRSLMISTMNKKMKYLAENLRFEEALVVKKSIEKIKKNTINTPIDFKSLIDIDIFTIVSFENKACILKTFIRDGKFTSSVHKIVKHQEDIDLTELYKRVIVDFYTSNNIVKPQNVLIADEICEEEIILLEDFLYRKFNKKISIVFPKLGNKKNLIEITYKNAKTLLENEALNSKDEVVLRDIKNTFHLDEMPYRIESYDNSHISQSARVGGMIVYENEKFDKSSYRLFNLKSKDEYSQMSEMLTRRIDGVSANSLPNLWVIDGGKTLLNLALSIVESMGLNIDVIAISKEKIDAKSNRSKGKARDIIHTKNNEFRLDVDDKRLIFVQKMRDEAHRFAIKNHRLAKLKEDKQISLLNIHGIGEAKVKKLLNYFGNFELIKTASIKELEMIVSKDDAISLQEYFKISKNN